MAKPNLRDKYRGTPINTVKAKAEEEDSEIGVSAGRSGYLEITDQLTNKFRLYPSHHPEGLFMIPTTKAWLSVEKDNGEQGRTTVFHGVRHGHLKQDPIEAYIATCQSLLKGDEKLVNLVGEYKKGGGGREGLSFQTTWIAYADKIKPDKSKQFGLLELKKSVRDALNSQAAIESDDQQIEIDPYTDSDTGRPILIKYNKNAKKVADYYKTQVSSAPLALTDDELESFDSKTPLVDMFGKVYSEKDFDSALEGLRNFDEEHEMGIFDSTEFQDIIETLRNQLENQPKAGKTTTSKTTKATPAKTSNKKVVEEEEEEEEEIAEEEEEAVEEEVSGDPLDEMSRDELKAFIKDNDLGELVKVFKNDTEETLREKIRPHVSFGDEDEATEEEDEVVEEEEIEDDFPFVDDAEPEEEIEEEAPTSTKKTVTTKPAAKTTASPAAKTAPKTGNASVDALKNKLKGIANKKS
jgi:hypothetical protein